MKNRHLKTEELLAVAEKRFSLLPEAERHIESCECCSSTLRSFSESMDLLKALKNTEVLQNASAANKIADASFAYISGEGVEKSNKHSFFNPLAIAFSLCLIFVVSLSLSHFYDTPESKSDSYESTLADDLAKVNLEPGTENSGTVPPMPTKLSTLSKGSEFAMKRARIRVLDDSDVAAENENKILLNRGTIDVEVKKGGDFHILAGQNYIVRVLGTRFVVKKREDYFSVRVIEGLVEVVDKTHGKNFTLEKEMKKEFFIKKIVHRPVEIKKTVPHQRLRTPSTSCSTPKKPIIDYYTKAKKVLSAGELDSAYTLFKKELSSGKNRERALFEMVRISEKNKNFAGVVSLLEKNKPVLESSKLYGEEFYIKACKAQTRIEGNNNLSYCTAYLKKFPEGYKTFEISDLLENRNE